MKASSGEWMLQQPQQGNRRELCSQRARQQPQEHRGRGFRQSLASAVVCDDAVTRQSSGYPAGQVAVGCDKGGGTAGGFHRLAQDHRNCLGLFLHIARAEAPKPVRRGGERILPGRKRSRRQ